MSALEGIPEAFSNSLRYVMLLAPVGFCWLMSTSSLPVKIVSDLLGIDSSPIQGFFRKWTGFLNGKEGENDDYSFWSETFLSRVEEFYESLKTSHNLGETFEEWERNEETSMEQKEKLDEKKKKKIQILRELQPKLESLISLLDYDSFNVEGGKYEERFVDLRLKYPKEFQKVSENLIRLWETLFQIVNEIVEEKTAFWVTLGIFTVKGIEGNYFKLLSSVVRRGELDALYRCKKSNEEEKLMDLEKKVETLMLKTQLWVEEKLSDSPSYYQRSNLYLFCIKFLAISSFRLSEEVQIPLVNFFEGLKEEELEHLLELKQRFNLNTELEPAQSEDCEQDALFLWKESRSQKREERSEEENEDFDRLSRAIHEKSATWVQVLKKENTFFLLFLKEYISLVSSRKVRRGKRRETSLPYRNRIDWKKIPYFEGLLSHFFVIVSQEEKIGGYFSDCIVSTITANPKLINFYSRVLFLNTPTDRFMAVLDSLSVLETWLDSLKSSSVTFSAQTFDLSFLFQVFETIFNFDHHQIVGKCLTIFYNHFDTFESDAKKKIYQEFLLDKHFDYFFCHWDESVRNSFQQILVFKTGRINRSVTTHPDRNATGDDSKLLLYNKTEEQLERINRYINESNSNSKFVETKKIYAMKSLEEYKIYLSRFEAWKSTGGKLPRMVPLSLIRSATKANP